MRALLYEQIDAKMVAARVAERIINSWDDDTMRSMVARFPVEMETTRIFPRGARGEPEAGAEPNLPN